MQLEARCPTTSAWARCTVDAAKRAINRCRPSANQETMERVKFIDFDNCYFDAIRETLTRETKWNAIVQPAADRKPQFTIIVLDPLRRPRDFGSFLNWFYLITPRALRCTCYLRSFSLSFNHSMSAWLCSRSSSNDSKFYMRWSRVKPIRICTAAIERKVLRIYGQYGQLACDAESFRIFHSLVSEFRF